MTIEEHIKQMEAWCVTDIAVSAQESWEEIKRLAKFGAEVENSRAANLLDKT